MTCRVFLIWIGLLIVVASSIFAAYAIVKHTSHLGESVASSVSDGKGLMCSETVYNFGQLDLQHARDLRHVFTLHNASAYPIHIHKQTSTCNCSSVDISNSIVPPGGRIDVSVTTQWANREGPQSVDIVLSTDSQDTPSITLGIRGDIIVPAIVRPTHVDFGQLIPRQRATRIISICPRDPTTPFRITGVECSSRRFSVSRVNDDRTSLVRLPLEGPPGDFLLETTAPAEAGHDAVTICFRTDINTLPKLVVACEARYTGMFIVQPQSLVCLFPRNTNIRKDTVHVRSYAHDSPPTATVIWDGPGESPFDISLSSTTPDASPDYTDSSITVQCNRDKLHARLVAAILRVAVGETSLRLPVIAIIQD